MNEVLERRIAEMGARVLARGAPVARLRVRPAGRWFFVPTVLWRSRWPRTCCVTSR